MQPWDAVPYSYSDSSLLTYIGSTSTRYIQEDVLYSYIYRTLWFPYVARVFEAQLHACNVAMWQSNRLVLCDLL